VVVVAAEVVAGCVVALVVAVEEVEVEAGL
jgi:hypothetical protein